MRTQSDRARWDAKYLHDAKQIRVNSNLVRFTPQLKPGYTLDLAGGLGQNGAFLANYSSAFRVINADIAEQGLLQASRDTSRAVVDADALPFPQNSFDTILNFRFYAPHLKFADWLTDGGTVLFETFTSADEKYRPDFNPAHRFPLEQIPIVFQGLEILHQEETDSGHRVYITVLAQKRN